MRPPGEGSRRPTEGAALEADRPSRITEIFLEQSRIEAALRRAARDALLAHKRAGQSVPMWVDGRTVWVPPEEIEIPEEEPVDDPAPVEGTPR